MLLASHGVQDARERDVARGPVLPGIAAPEIDAAGEEALVAEEGHLDPDVGHAVVWLVAGIALESPDGVLDGLTNSRARPCEPVGGVREQRRERLALGLRNGPKTQVEGKAVRISPQRIGFRHTRRGLSDVTPAHAQLGQLSVVPAVIVDVALGRRRAAGANRPSGQVALGARPRTQPVARWSAA